MTNRRISRFSPSPWGDYTQGYPIGTLWSTAYKFPWVPMEYPWAGKTGGIRWWLL